jgi:hypothetical protein
VRTAMQCAECLPPGSKKPALWVVVKVTPERRGDQKRTK